MRQTVTLIKTASGQPFYASNPLFDRPLCFYVPKNSVLIQTGKDGYRTISKSFFQAHYAQDEKDSSIYHPKAIKQEGYAFNL